MRETVRGAHHFTPHFAHLFARRSRAREATIASTRLEVSPSLGNGASKSSCVECGRMRFAPMAGASQAMQMVVGGRADFAVDDRLAVVVGFAVHGAAADAVCRAG